MPLNLTYCFFNRSASRTSDKLKKIHNLTSRFLKFFLSLILNTQTIHCRSLQHSRDPTEKGKSKSKETYKLKLLIMSFSMCATQKSTGLLLWKETVYSLLPWWEGLTLCMVENFHTAKVSVPHAGGCKQQRKLEVVPVGAALVFTDASPKCTRCLTHIEFRTRALKNISSTLGSTRGEGFLFNLTTL